MVALAGQPNCGKSTIFNALAGFKVNTANFAGTTVTYTETKVQIGSSRIQLIDLPGTYSISSQDLAEKVARDYVLSGKVDVIVNVVDASLLSRSLELTIQLLEMNLPMVLAVNMIDEADRKGISVNTDEIGRLIGIPVCPLVALRGQGVSDLFDTVLRLANDRATYFQPLKPTYDRDVEVCLTEILSKYPDCLRQTLRMDERFVAIRLLEMDEEFMRQAAAADARFASFVSQKRQALAELHNWPESSVFASHRHALVLDLYEKVTVLEHRGRPGLRDSIDAFITNPVGGVAAVLASFFLLFYCSFWIGSHLSQILEYPFLAVRAFLEHMDSSLAKSVLGGLADGIEAGAGIVLPYLVPLLFVFAIFEDSGLLPRIAFMVDGILHRVGLHGKSVVPIILGYGCNVPALMAARNLENPRDRLVTLLIIPFITCSARTVVILALAGRYLGALWTTVIYIVTLAVPIAVSFALSRFNIEMAPGIIMEVPPLRRPIVKLLAKKVWLRLWEFIFIAWPVIAVASMALALVSWSGVDRSINSALSILTVDVLKLPAVLGIPLFLGVFRKELALVMLTAALGTAQITSALSHQQIFVFVIFTALYIPCIATLSTLWKEGGFKTALISAALNFSVALLLAGALARIPQSWLILP